ncbi:MAG: threonine-phosphate decarboxylase CobD [Steroidobacteraceae bacterium]
MLEHGGRLRRAARRYGIALDQWLDLSTGVNPISWGGADVPQAAWARLPEDDDGLIEAAQGYYCTRNVLPVAGSQAAIMHLPRLRAACRVGVLAPGYLEHAVRWREAGHDVMPLTADQCAAAAGSVDVLVLINPNNPTGHHFPRRRLLQWHSRLAARGGWLVVDEAFADTDPAETLAAFTDRQGLIVLRSLGKFFGLAGARVGFVLAAAPLRHVLDECLGPWAVAGPARFVARGALEDRPWHAATRARLKAQSARLSALLRERGFVPAGGCALFQWVPAEAAPALHESFARRGILTRLFDTPRSLRFGLPGREEDWQRLDTALAASTADDA